MLQDLKKLQEIGFHSDQILLFFTALEHLIYSRSYSLACGYQCSSLNVHKKDGGQMQDLLV